MAAEAAQSTALFAVEVPRREGYVVRIGLHAPDKWNPEHHLDLRLWTRWAAQKPGWAQKRWAGGAEGAPTRKGLTVGLAQLEDFRAALDRVIAEARCLGLLDPNGDLACEGASKQDSPATDAAPSSALPPLHGDIDKGRADLPAPAP